MKGPEDEVCAEIRQVVLCIETEASSRGLLDKESLVDVFETVEDQQAVGKMFDEWYGIRSQLLDDLAQNKCDSAEQQLNKLAEMNNQFLRMERML